MVRETAANAYRVVRVALEGHQSRQSTRTRVLKDITQKHKRENSVEQYFASMFTALPANQVGPTINASQLANRPRSGFNRIAPSGGRSHNVQVGSSRANPSGPMGIIQPAPSPGIKLGARTSRSPRGSPHTRRQRSESGEMSNRKTESSCDDAEQEEDSSHDNEEDEQDNRSKITDNSPIPSRDAPKERKIDKRKTASTGSPRKSKSGGTDPPSRVSTPGLGSNTTSSPASVGGAPSPLPLKQSSDSISSSKGSLVNKDNRPKKTSTVQRTPTVKKLALDAAAMAGQEDDDPN